MNKLDDHTPMTDAERANYYLHLIAQIRDALLSKHDITAADWIAEVMSFPSSVIDLAKARMAQIDNMQDAIYESWGDDN